MKCDEVQTLHGPYLDSELDAKNSLEIQQHLKTCPGCARLFADAEKRDAQMMAGLSRGPRTAAVWVVILALNLAARELNAPLAAGQGVPSASELRFAVKQKQLLMADLAFTFEPAPADKRKAAPPSPRSDRRNETLTA